MSEVKDQGHILYPVSNRCTSFSFHINRTNHSWDMAKIVFDLEKTCPIFWKKTAVFCSDPMIGSHFIAQTSNFLLIDATAVTLVQGHQKVTQYICPDSYILCAKYLRFSWNGVDVRGKSCCGGGRGGRGGGGGGGGGRRGGECGENELKI